MDRDEMDPIFMDEGGYQPLCFDTCERFGLDCRNCEKFLQSLQSS